MMMFLALFTLICAVTSNFVSARLLADTDNAKSFENDDDVEDTMNIMDVSRRRIWYRFKQCGVYKGHHSHAQYLYLNGRCRHIQSGNSIRYLYGRNVYKTVNEWTMRFCIKGHPIRGTAKLVRGRGTHLVYAIFNGRKHHVYSPRTMSRCQFNWNNVIVVSRSWLRRFRTSWTIRA